MRAPRCPLDAEPSAAASPRPSADDTAPAPAAPRHRAPNLTHDRQLGRCTNSDWILRRISLSPTPGPSLSVNIAAGACGVLKAQIANWTYLRLARISNGADLFKRQQDDKRTFQS